MENQIAQETLEQAQASALDLSRGYDGVLDGNTYYGLGWVVTLHPEYNLLTATYETEDGELLTWGVDLEATGLLDNQPDLPTLIEQVLYAVGEYGDWEGWTLLA